MSLYKAALLAGKKRKRETKPILSKEESETEENYPEINRNLRQESEEEKEEEICIEDLENIIEKGPMDRKTVRHILVSLLNVTKTIAQDIDCLKEEFLLLEKDSQSQADITDDSEEEI
jgi:hypothetical protein